MGASLGLGAIDKLFAGGSRTQAVLRRCGAIKGNCGLNSRWGQKTAHPRERWEGALSLGGASGLRWSAEKLSRTLFRLGPAIFIATLGGIQHETG